MLDIPIKMSLEEFDEKLSTLDWDDLFQQSVKMMEKDLMESFQTDSKQSICENIKIKQPIDFTNQQEVIKLCDEFKYFLEQNHFNNSPYVDLMDFENWGICCYIDWGDWKHEHARFDYLAKMFFKETFGYEPQIYANVDEEDGSDCYSANHVIDLTKPSKQFNNALHEDVQLSYMIDYLVNKCKFNKQNLLKKPDYQIFAIYNDTITKEQKAASKAKEKSKSTNGNENIDLTKEEEPSIPDCDVLPRCKTCGALLLDDKSCPYCIHGDVEVEHSFVHI